MLLVAEGELLAQSVNGDGSLAGDLIVEQLLAQVVEHVVLYGPLDGTGTEVGVVAPLGQELYP